MWPKSYPRVSESEILRRRNEPASKELIVHLWRRWIAEYRLMKVNQYAYGKRGGPLLMTEFILGRSSVGAALLAGALRGIATSGVVFLARGGWSSGDARYVLPTRVVEGLVLGIVVRWLLL